MLPFSAPSTTDRYPSLGSGREAARRTSMDARPSNSPNEWIAEEEERPDVEGVAFIPPLLLIVTASPFVNKRSGSPAMPRGNPGNVPRRNRRGAPEPRRRQPQVLFARTIRAEMRALEGRPNAIPRAPFARVVRDITNGINPNVVYRYQASALFALQEVAENFLVQMMETLNILALHAGRKTIMNKDVAILKRIPGSSLSEIFRNMNIN
ncbi:unnamed protein product [Cyprideis torosa]|uniref:Core Histone H2A/H2B/H3 domain-containing protein n=1 Tax=Cyprideis torosa TaxID=163714 RepID=A0A7R8ZJA5_9CRUS|nr:unnamed protein product [Cyprideis torosa]CAG0881823.1 unnamed protein product [Cyprideis torosa]